jgi:hypothetical protein
MDTRLDTYHPSLISESLGAANGLIDHFFMTQCDTGTAYVNLQVTCHSRGDKGKSTCGVDRIRKLLGPTDPPNQSVLESIRIFMPNDTGVYVVSYERFLFDTLMDSLD